jgi:hypothetical protein
VFHQGGAASVATHSAVPSEPPDDLVVGYKLRGPILFVDPTEETLSEFARPAASHHRDEALNVQLSPGFPGVQRRLYAENVLARVLPMPERENVLGLGSDGALYHRREMGARNSVVLDDAPVGG